MTIPELKDLMKKLGLSGYSALKKDDLVEKILVTPADRAELDSKLLPDLQALAKTLCIKGISRKNKEDLRELILKRHLAEKPVTASSAPLHVDPAAVKKQIPLTKDKEKVTNPSTLVPPKGLMKPQQKQPALNSSSSSAAAAAAASSSAAHVQVHIHHAPAVPVAAAPAAAPSAATKPLYYADLVRQWKLVFMNHVGMEVRRLRELKDKAERNHSENSDAVAEWAGIVIASCDKVAHATYKDFDWLFAMDHDVEYKIMDATERLYKRIGSLMLLSRDPILSDPLLYLIMSKWAAPKRT
jgi:hypothetical protein